MKKKQNKKKTKKGPSLVEKVRNEVNLKHEVALDDVNIFT